MEHVNFRPWIGKNYFTSGYHGKKILVLGESHYCSEVSQEGSCYPICSKANMTEKCHGFTKNGLHDLIYNYSGIGNRRYEQTFLCFERAIEGKVLSQKEREDFWESIMFYNFLQYVQEGPRMPVKSEYWNNSEQAFKEVLEMYLPDYIIIWGTRLYNGLPNWGGVNSQLRVSDDFSADVWTYTIKGKQIPALKVIHPSTPRGKNWTFWHNVYNKFFEIY